MPETFDYKVQYDIQLVISDRLTTLPTVNAIISKGIPIMWWNGSKVVVNGELDIANSDGTARTTINDGNIWTYRSMNIRADGTNISYQQGGLPILRNNGTDSTLLAGNGNIYLRPNCHTNSSGETKIASNGNMSVSGSITTGGKTVATTNDVNAVKSKKEVLWTGSFSPTANNTYRTMTISKNVYDYDFLLIDVCAGDALLNRKTVILVIEGQGVTCAVREAVFYNLESYRFSFGVQTDGNKTIAFKVQDMSNYTLSEIKMTKIIGVKL